MRLLYTFLFYLGLPFVFLRLLWRARKNPAYAKRWGERLGFLSKISDKKSIWVHAVSVGETIAAVPLIKKLQQRYPNTPIVVTTTTPTGADRVRAAFGNSVTHFYSPYDVPFALNRFIKQVQPQLLILIETELWPNMLHTCCEKNIPVMLANARLSEKSAKAYRLLGSLTSNMLQSISVFAVQTETEAQRFIALGANPKNIHVTGSIKFDLDIPEDLFDRAAHLKKELGENRLIWIAASTHETEENIILNAHTEVRKIIPDSLLILVPRHPERFARVKELCVRSGFNVVSRSEKKPCTEDTAIFLGDTMGELLLFYAVSAVAFVGGSLIEKGGHNPLEPAALGLPVLMGKHVFNFAQICAQLKNSIALIEVANASEIEKKVNALLQDKTLQEKMSSNAREFVVKNRGALNKQFEMVEDLLAF